MSKKSVLRKNKIALFLAVMLMFSAFWAEGTTLDTRLLSGDVQVSRSTLLGPQAGEFFTGSLPRQSQQSVRELSGEWNGFVVLRPGRIAGGKNGYKEIHENADLSVSLRKTTFCREYPITECGAHTAHGREVIICYIHNQDGAKG